MDQYAGARYGIGGGDDPRRRGRVAVEAGRGIQHHLECPWVYIYKCSPHMSLGMVGAIVVGEGKPANLDAIKSNPREQRDDRPRDPGARQGTPSERG